MKKALILIIMSFLFYSKAYAFMIESTLIEKVNDSSAIIIGTPIKISPEWNSDHSTIFTYVTLKVDKYIVSPHIFLNPSTEETSLSNEVVIRHAGGFPDGPGTLGLEVEDEPSLEIGEAYLIFLQKDYGKSLHFKENDKKGNYVVTHGFQGSLKINRENKVYNSALKKNVPLENFVKEIHNIINQKNNRR